MSSINAGKLSQISSLKSLKMAKLKNKLSKPDFDIYDNKLSKSGSLTQRSKLRATIDEAITFDK
jgi:hypothetical protein